MDITGSIKYIGKPQDISEKFSKCEFVVTDSSTQYPQHILFQVTNDKIDLIKKLKIGQQVKVYFNLRGREWASPKGEVKYFNTLEAWKIEGGVSNGQPNEYNNSPSNGNSTEGFDDLPF